MAHTTHTPELVQYRQHITPLVVRAVREQAEGYRQEADYLESVGHHEAAAQLRDAAEQTLASLAR